MIGKKRGFNPHNGEMFNKKGTTNNPAIYNGFGTTRTTQAPTLFVTNVPPGLPTSALTQIFERDEGFQQVRCVRNMIFVDFFDIKTSTNAMRTHQNEFFEGYPADQGIMIDYDKDPRHKRNKAYTGQVEQGNYSNNKHDIILTSLKHHQEDDLIPLKKDNTLELINKMKKDYESKQGIEVPFDSTTKLRTYIPTIVNPNEQQRYHSLNMNIKIAQNIIKEPEQSLISIPIKDNIHKNNGLTTFIRKKLIKTSKKEEEKGEELGIEDQKKKTEAIEVNGSQDCEKEDEVLFEGLVGYSSSDDDDS